MTVAPRSGRALAVYADGPDGPLPAPADLDGLPADAAVVLGWVVRTPPWLAGRRGPVTTLMAGYGMAAPVAAGDATAVPTRLSSVPGLLRSRLVPDVAVVGGRPEGAGFRFAGAVGWGPVAARAARRVVVEVWSDAPTYDSPLIEGEVVATLEREAPRDPPPRPVIGPEERRIGELVAGLVPAGATVQWGPGTIGAAVIDALRVPVRVLSGLVTDELAALADRGLLVGAAEAAYLWGGDRLHDLAAAGGVRLRSVEQTHDPGRLAAIDRFVAVNTALEVGLDGAVNVEVAGARTVAGPGGHPDFCEAASRSAGGISVIALRSTHRGRSSIVARPAVVSTARADVDVVVTEHGVADLRGATDGERARRLIAVATPEHRDALSRSAPD